MPASKRAATPAGLMALRLPAALEREVREDAAELGVDLSTWWRAAARAKLDARLVGELRAIRELVEHATRLGLTAEHLRAAAKLLT